MPKDDFILTPENYYSLEADKRFCSASQLLSFVGRSGIPGCEARTMAILNGEYKEESTKAMLIGSILDLFWELEDLPMDEKLNIIADQFPECVSTRGATKGELKTEYKQALKLYERTLKDPLFRQFMSGTKQCIMQGVIDGLPFKIKMDSYIPGVAIVDLKTTQDASKNFRKYVEDSGNRETFYKYMSYDVQLSLYREIVRQNTGQTLRCYICAVDKKEHPLPQIIELPPKMLDEALLTIKSAIPTIKLLKSGEITNYVRCEECDYCRDTYKCKVLSAEEFETSDS